MDKGLRLGSGLLLTHHLRQDDVGAELASSILFALQEIERERMDMIVQIPYVSQPTLLIQSW